VQTIGYESSKDKEITHSSLPAQQEAPQPSRFLGLTKHRLHGRLALGIDLPARLLAQLAGHPAFGIQEPVAHRFFMRKSTNNATNAD
jgi:hypothetical protein